MEQLEKSADEKMRERGELEETIWKIFQHHWKELAPLQDMKKAMKSGSDFQIAKQRLEEAGGSWEKLKARKEKEYFDEKEKNAKSEK